jgi:hypothetical protein
VVTAGASLALATPLTEATTPGNVPRILQVVVFVVALAVVGLVYAGCAWILRVPELFATISLAARRIPAR